MSLGGISNGYGLGDLEKPFQSPQIIAEIGTAHRGDIERARDLIAAAASAGADYAKFQIIYASEILHPNTGIVPLPGGPTSLYEIFQKLEQPRTFYEKLMEICSDYSIGFLCTPFGIKSAMELQNLGVKSFKVASPELNHHPLLEYLASLGKPVILSSGVSRLKDIDESLDFFRNKNLDLTLLHCITSYPAPEEEYNLRLVDTLSRIFGIPTGVSDHSLDPLFIPALSGIMGARYVEKHITLSRSDGGLDDPIALEPHNLEALISRLKSWNNSSRSEVLNHLEIEFGEDRVISALGNGIKSLAPSEADNYGRTNRSIHVLQDLEPGDILTQENCAILRTEKVLNPGLHPRYYSLILGKKLTTYIKSGQGLNWDDFFQDY